jgi:hypothetical protein
VSLDRKRRCPENRLSGDRVRALDLVNDPFGGRAKHVAQCVEREGVRRRRVAMQGPRRFGGKGVGLVERGLGLGGGHDASSVASARSLKSVPCSGGMAIRT